VVILGSTLSGSNDSSRILGLKGITAIALNRHWGIAEHPRGVATRLSDRCLVRGGERDRQQPIGCEVQNSA
jgi:hypothetical protein